MKYVSPLTLARERIPVFPMEWLLYGNFKHLKKSTSLTEEEKEKLTKLSEELEIQVDEMDKDLAYL